MAGVRITGLSKVLSADLTLTGNTALGDAISDLIGMYGIAGTSQRRSASQAAVTTLTGSKTTTNTAARLNALIKMSVRIRDDLVAVGAIKGAA